MAIIVHVKNDQARPVGTKGARVQVLIVETPNQKNPIEIFLDRDQAPYPVGEYILDAEAMVIFYPDPKYPRQMRLGLSSDLVLRPKVASVAPVDKAAYAGQR